MNYSQYKIAILVSRFNEEITQGLKSGALSTLSEHQVSSVKVFDAPGAFEIPLLAQELARTKKFDGVICLGCVIKGDTAHFEFISLGATLGIQQATLATGVPITFGVITTYTEEQALVRSKVSGPEASHNKGREATLACLETIARLHHIRNL